MEGIAANNREIVLVAGAGGVVGRAVADRLAASGWKVAALGHKDLDITNPEAVTEAIRLAGPNVVINCAASTDVDRCEREPEWAFAVNDSGPRLLARACRESGAKMVHISTDYVFDGKKAG